MNKGDEISALVRQLTEFLGATHPIRLGVGVCFGVAFYGGLQIVASIFPDSVGLRTAASLSAVYSVICWIGLVFLPLPFGARGAPENAVNYIRALRLMMDQSDLSPQMRKMMWRALIQKYLDEARPDLSGRPSAEALYKQAEVEVKTSTTGDFKGSV